MALQADESLKNTFAGKERIAANLVGDGELQQAGGQQQKQKTEAVLGDDVGPPNQLTAALRQSHKDDAWSQSAKHARHGWERRLLVRRQGFPGGIIRPALVFFR